MTIIKKYTMTPKLIKKRAKENLSKCKDELYLITIQEKEILEKKNECLFQMTYWEIMSK